MHFVDLALHLLMHDSAVFFWELHPEIHVIRTMSGQNIVVTVIFLFFFKRLGAGFFFFFA